MWWFACCCECQQAIFVDDLDTLLNSLQTHVAATDGKHISKVGIVPYMMELALLLMIITDSSGPRVQD